MYNQTYLTDWHPILLVAAGILTAILSVWLQSEERFFYEKIKYEREEAKEVKKEEKGGKAIYSFSDLRYSVQLAGFWLSGGIFFALLAFGLTGLDWLFSDPSGLLKLFAEGFLISAFTVTLFAVMKSMFHDLGLTLWKAKEEIPRPLDYGFGDERVHIKRYIFVTLCYSLLFILAISILIAFLAPVK